MDDWSKARAFFAQYIKDHPEEIAEAQRMAREVVFKCTNVLHSYDDAMAHVNRCTECSRALGIISIDIELPKASD